MRRPYVDVSVTVFVVALLASLAVHLPVYGVLGHLSKLFKDAETHARQSAPEPVEIEIMDAPPAEPVEPSVQEDDVPVAAPVNAPRPRERQRPRRVEEEEEETPEEEEPEPVEVEVAPEAPPPEEIQQDTHAIEQQAQNDEPPPETQYVAEHANRVEEETVAELRNEVTDDVEQETGEELEPSDEEELGNAEEEELAEVRDMEGADERAPTEEETREDRPEEADDTPPPNLIAEGDTAERGNNERSRDGADRAQEEAIEASAGEEETITINDGSGTLIIRRPRQGAGGQDFSDVLRQARQGGGSPSRQRLASGSGRGSHDEGPDLRVSWSDYEQQNEEQLQQERETYIAERTSKNRGSSRRNWGRFRAAIENYTQAVRPGNSTALNARASPFASYIAQVHRRLHRKFAGSFLPGLSRNPSHPMGDMSLRTRLEIIFNGDGSIHRVGVARSSGVLPFDYGAFNSVMRGQPYPAPPDSILSADGKVYLHWGFYRAHRQCGVFNAAPYILSHPPRSRRPRNGGTQAAPDLGSVVPADARVTWGGGEEAESGEAGEGEPEPSEPSEPSEPAEPAEPSATEPTEPSEPAEPSPTEPSADP